MRLGRGWQGVEPFTRRLHEFSHGLIDREWVLCFSHHLIS
jgi:hypothetical protein